MPDLDRVPERMVGVRGGHQLAVDGDSLIMVPGERRRLTGRPRQLREEVRHASAIEAQAGWQLPQHRPELRPQGEHPGGQEVGQGSGGIGELLHVRDEPAALDREDEVRRGLLRPRGEAGRALQRVKRAVDLNRVHAFGHVRQLPAVRQLVRIERAPPRLVRPAGDPDPRLPALRQAEALRQAQEATLPKFRAPSTSRSNTASSSASTCCSPGLASYQAICSTAASA